MRKFIYLITPLVLFYSCTSGHKSDEENSAFYPDTMSLWKAIDGPEYDDEIYFFFPNDSLILQYDLRTWLAYSESGEKDLEMSDFTANHIYIKKDTGYMHHHAYWKRFSEFTFTQKESKLEMNLDDRSKNYSGIYTLEKVNNFDSLPSDPKQNWLSYYHDLFSDTLVRFTSMNPTNYIIYSHRGIDFDTLEMEPYYGTPNYQSLNESDTFFVAKETDRVFVVQRWDTQNSIALNTLGAFEIALLNRRDSLAMERLMEKIKALKDSTSIE